MNKLMVSLLIGTLFSVNTFAADSSLGLNISQIEKLTGMKGQVNSKEKVFKVFEPRDDLKISMSGIKMMPAMGLTSWVSFKKAENETMITGDLVLSEDQINPVMDVVLKNKIRITSLQNHFLWETPKVMFMHIEATGKETELASSVGKIFKEIDATRNGAGSFPIADIDSTKTTLNPKRIDAILGSKGVLKNGVYKVAFGNRTEIDGTEVNSAMGINTWAAFAGSDQEAIVIGDFAVEDSNLEKVLLTLHDAGIYVVSIYQQVSDEDPQMVFLHYLGVGNTQHLAKAIRTALNTSVATPAKIMGPATAPNPADTIAPIPPLALPIPMVTKQHAAPATMLAPLATSAQNSIPSNKAS